MHPAAGHGDLGTQAWTPIRCNIGRWLGGTFLDRILVAYEHAENCGNVFQTYIDDIYTEVLGMLGVGQKKGNRETLMASLHRRCIRWVRLNLPHHSLRCQVAGLGYNRLTWKHCAYRSHTIKLLTYTNAVNLR